MVEEQEAVNRKRKAPEQLEPSRDGGEDDDLPKKLCVGNSGSGSGSSVKSEIGKQLKIKNIILTTFSSSSAQVVGVDHGGQVDAQGAGVGGGRRGAVQNARAKNFSALQACTGRPDSAAAGIQNGTGQRTFGKGRN